MTTTAIAFPAVRLSLQLLGIGPRGAARAGARPSFGANSLGQSGIPFTRRSLTASHPSRNIPCLDNPLSGRPYRAMDSSTQRPAGPAAAARNLDEAEVERFEQLANEWWDANGKLRPLHQQGPARLGFIRDALVSHFGRPAGELKPLRGLPILDVGCGGGLVA
ncbi:MAG: hypothetical protein WC684_02215, partial [Hyphomicrobium sp.]